jgi:hypothetical protein
MPSTTISSGSWNTATALYTITLSADIGLQPGSLVQVASAAGTGTPSRLNGVWTTVAGTGGTTLVISNPAGLTTSLSGGNVNASLDYVAAGTKPVTNNQFSTLISGATPSAYNGTYTVTSTSDTTFTYTFAGASGTPASGSVTFQPPFCVPQVSGQDVISDNALVPDTNQASGFVTDPESTGFNEPIQDVIWERNYILQPGKNFSYETIDAQRVTFRLNIINQPAMIPDNGGNGLFVELGVIQTPVPVNNWFYNNTQYATGTGSSNHFDSVRFQYQMGNHYARNHLVYIPNDSSPAVIAQSTNATPGTFSNNSSNAQAKSTSPLFTNASGAFTAPADFTPNTGSYAIAAGATVPVYYDFFRVPLVPGSYPIGALHQ